MRWLARPYKMVRVIIKIDVLLCFDQFQRHMSTPSNTGDTWKRFFRFGIGTLLILVTVFCVWLSFVVRRATTQRRAVEIVTEAGGSLHYQHETRRWPLPHHEFPSAATFDASLNPPGNLLLRRWLGDDFFRKIVMIDLVEKKAGQVENLAALANLDGLLWLNLGYNEVTDEGLSVLGQMSQLRVLCLDRNRFTDQGLAHLTELQRLEQLDLSMNRHLDGSGLEYVAQLKSLKDLDLQLLPNLDGDSLAALKGHPTLEQLMIGQTPLSDEHLRHLSSIPNLWQLGIDRTNVTDKGVIYLAENSNLKHLYLEGSGITDRCVESLARMSTLEYLSLTNTQTTDAGIRRFKQAAPGCMVQKN